LPAGERRRRLQGQRVGGRRQSLRQEARRRRILAARSDRRSSKQHGPFQGRPRHCDYGKAPGNKALLAFIGESNPRYSRERVTGYSSPPGFAAILEWIPRRLSVKGTDRRPSGDDSPDRPQVKDRNVCADLARPIAIHSCAAGSRKVLFAPTESNLAQAEYAPAISPRNTDAPLPAVWAFRRALCEPLHPQREATARPA